MIQTKRALVITLIAPVAFILSVLLSSAFSLYNYAAAQTIPGPTIAISINPSTNKIYVANPATGFISVIAGTTDTVAKTFKLPVPTPVSVTLSVNPSTNKIYVATHPPTGVGGGMMFVITGVTDMITKLFPIS